MNRCRRRSSGAFHGIGGELDQNNVSARRWRVELHCYRPAKLTDRWVQRVTVRSKDIAPRLHSEQGAEVTGSDRFIDRKGVAAGCCCDLHPVEEDTGIDLVDHGSPQ